MNVHKHIFNKTKNLFDAITFYNSLTLIGIGTTKKGTRGGLGPPNKEQNWGKKLQNGAFLGCGNSWKYLL